MSVREVVPFLESFTGESAVYNGDKVSVGLFKVERAHEGVIILNSVFPGVLPHVFTFKVGNEKVWFLRFYSPEGHTVPYKSILRDLNEDELASLFSTLFRSGHLFRFRDEGGVKDERELIERIKYPALQPSAYSRLEVIYRGSEPVEIFSLITFMRKEYAKVFPKRRRILDSLIESFKAETFVRVEGEWQILNTKEGKLLCSREVGSENYGIFLFKEGYVGRFQTFHTSTDFANAPFVSGTVPDLGGDLVFLGYSSDVKNVLHNLESLENIPRVTFTFKDELSPKEEEGINVLYKYKNLLLIGPPGTGKTYLARRIAERVAGPEGRNWVLVQASPSLRYEDFVEGLRPIKKEGGVVFDVVEGPFINIVKKAVSRKNERFAIILDEMNRGNVPAILGDLLYALEYRGKPVLMPYSKTLRAVPENFFFIGTLNERDVSALQLDQAVLRRFPVLFLEPDAENLRNYLRNNGWRDEDVDWALEIFKRLNEVLKNSLGHAYFFAKTPEELRDRLRYFVRPLLRLKLNEDLEEILKDLI